VRANRGFSGREDSMKLHHLALGGLLLLGLAVLGQAGEETARKLLGVWELTKAEKLIPGATVEFAKDNKMHLRFKAGDKAVTIDGTYKLEGKTIVSTLSFGGKSKTETNTIKKLTDKELVIEDEKGKVEEYKRAK
jgi:uncharacterized protein (TIGR03066 family)